MLVRAHPGCMPEAHPGCPTGRIVDMTGRDGPAAGRARGRDTGRSLAAYPGQYREHGPHLAGWIRVNGPRPGNVCLGERILALSVIVGARLLCGVGKVGPDPAPPPVL